MKKIFFTAVVFTFVLATPQNITAQNILTAEEAVATALKNNYDIQLLRNDSAAYALDKSYAKAAFLPSVKCKHRLGL